MPNRRITGRPPRRSAGVVPVYAPGDAPRFLLLRAYRNWDFPKGEIEPGESPLAAAQRETAEEAGLSGLRFPWGETFHETAPYAGGKIARYYIAEALTDEVRLGVNPLMGRPEHHEYRWVAAAEARALLVPRLQSVLAWAETVLRQPPVRR